MVDFAARNIWGLDEPAVMGSGRSQDGSRRRAQHGRSRPERRAPGRGPTLPRWARGNGDFAAAAAYLVAAGLFGGGLVAWSLSNIVLVAATIAFATVAAWRGAFAELAALPLPGRVAVAGIALLPLLQIVPLPPALWQALPGQELRRAVLALSGLADSWQPLSVEPVATALTAVMAVGFVAFIAVLLRLDDGDHARLLRLAFALIVLGIVVGGLQVVSDGQFPQLQADNMGATMLGFYANKNHMGLAIACSILFWGLAIGPDAFPPARRRIAIAGYVAFALVCIVTTNSRAGLGLGGLAAVIVLADLARGVPLRWRLAALGLVAVLAMAVMSSSAFETVGGRVGDVGSDLRWRISGWSWPLVKQYWLLGSGLGSFKLLFAAHEQLGWVKPTYVNAAHDDYLQLVIEAGLPGVALLLLLAMSVAGALVTGRGSGRSPAARRERVLGLGLILLFAIHSTVDYPLRRPAACVFFALGLVALWRSARGVRWSPSDTLTRGEPAGTAPQKARSILKLDG